MLNLQHAEHALGLRVASIRTPKLKSITGGAAEFIQGGSILHRFYDMHQAPTLAWIAFGGRCPLAFEIEVINQWIHATRSGSHAIEILFHLGLFCGRSLREHLG